MAKGTERAAAGSGDAPPDSLRGPARPTAADSLSRDVRPAPADSVVRREPPGHGWRSARRPAALELLTGVTVLEAARLDRVPENQLREILEWNAPARRIPSGAYNLPDPVDAGDLPGREPPHVLLEGTPLGSVGQPEMLPDAVGPFWLSRMVLRPFDPLTSPANPTGGPLLELELAGPDSVHAASGARLTSGSGDLYTEEFYLARPSRAGLVRGFYADDKMSGWDQGYDGQSGQNLLARFDRGEGWGGWRLNWHQSTNRIRRWDGPRLVWDRSATGGGVNARIGEWSADLDVDLCWERLAWQEAALPASRKTALTRSLLRVRGPEGVIRPLFSLQLDLQRLRFDQTQLPALDRTHRGLSFALGGEKVSSRWRARASIGRSSPTPWRSGWVGALDLERRLSSHWRAGGHLDRAVRAPLQPRVTDELEVLVGQALTVPIARADRPLEEILRLESTVARRWGRISAKAALLGGGDENRCELTGRLLEIRHAATADSGRLVQMQQGVYWLRLFPQEMLDRTVRAASLSGRITLALPRGFAGLTSVTGRWSDPSWDNQLWMTPWEGSFRVSWRHRFFEGDLDVEAALRGVWSAGRATARGIMSRTDRYDGSLTGGLGRATFFFLLQNLEDDLRESASNERFAASGGGLYATLPLRTYRVGLTWRFLD